MTELNDKELAIKTVEKLCDYDMLYMLSKAPDAPNTIKAIPKYLHDAAARVLFAMPDKDGVNRMPQKITSHLTEWAATVDRKGIYYNLQKWWRTLTPRKVLEVFIELEGE